MLRAFAARPFALAAAEGTFVTAADGRRFQDLGGASHGTNLIGHRHPAVVEAIARQAALSIHTAATWVDPARSRFLDALHARLPGPLTRTFMQNSGAEAVECALKLATAATGRSRFVALEGAFHGRTTGALAVTHNAAFRAPLRDFVPTSTFCPPELEALTDAVGRDTAALILEPVQGEVGVRPLPVELLRAARDLCDDHGALLICDEVQTGVGRTGTFLALARAGVEADIVTLGKGLAGGLPVGTCSATQAVTDALPPGGHGSTYGGAPIVAAAATAVLDVVDDRLIASAAAQADRFVQAVQDAPAVTEARQAGAMVAFGLKVRSGPVLDRLLAGGILALPAGPRGLRLLPPLTWSDPERAAATDTVQGALGT